MTLAILRALLVVVAAFTEPLFAASLPADSTDIVKLSEEWWGASIDDFPRTTRLAPGEYSVTDHPSKLGVRVIVVTKKQAMRWSPAALPAFAFDFDPKDGLCEISGFYSGSQQDTLSALSQRYGSPNRSVTSLGIGAYAWDFNATYLELRYGFFQLLPLRKIR